MDKNIGKKLDGRYEITELIGIGGMAEVYKGVDVIDGKTVAIKVLKDEYARNEEFLRRFRNESKAIAVLSHPNIVKIFDVGFSEKIQYIVMEYIDGITLKEYIEEEKVLSWKDTVHFVIQILRALQHAHDKGIVHRDIKPQNIMMFTDGTIKVMDFGIAKFASEEGITTNDQAIGSVHYISPEQASGAVTDAKSDIYSVGVMMYEMLTGKKPFDSDTAVSIAVMHMHDIPERPRAVNPDIPDGLEEIVLRAMEKAPEDRYGSTGEMIADIERFKANPSMTFGYYQEETEEESQFFGNENSVNLERGNEQYVTQNVYANAGGYGGGQQPTYDGGTGTMPRQYNDYYDPDGDEDDPDGDDDDEPRSSLVVPVLTAVVVVVMIVAVIFVATLLSGLLKGDRTNNDFKMPDFYGMDYNEAVSQYGNNIKFQEDGSEYNELDEGLIIEQDIAPGSEFKKGDTLKVKISKGMETVEVPNVSNMNSEIARDQLKQRGLECELKNSSSTEVQKGYVIMTEPTAGTEVHKGSTIVLYVSMGVDAGQVSVENYIGLVAEDAVKLAEYKGLKPVTELVASYEEEGKVVAQSIEKGEKVDEGTEIVFQVSNGVSPDGEIPFVVPFPAEAYGRFVIDFVLTHEDGSVSTQTTQTLLIPEMSSITENVKGSGENISVSVVLTNLNNQSKATIGTYSFNFATKVVTTQTEDIKGAFEAVDGLRKEEATTAPAETPAQNPAENPDTNAETPTANENENTTSANGNTNSDLPSNFAQDAGDGYGYWDEEGNYYLYSSNR